MFFQAFAIYCKNVAMYCKTVEFAMQIQRETLRLWVNQWSMATAAAVGRGGPIRSRTCRSGSWKTVPRG